MHGHRRPVQPALVALAATVGSLLLVVSGTASGQAPAPPPASLRFEEAVRLALSRNERARIADLNVVVADAAVDKARAGFLPVAGLTASDTLRAVASPTNLGNATLLVTQPLINAPAFPLYRQAKEAREGVRAQTVDDKRVLAFDAARAFFDVLSQQAVLEAADRRLSSAKANLDNAQARAQAQLSSSNDVTRAQINLGTSGREVELDRGGVESSMVQLSFVINAKVSGPLVVPSEILRVARLPLPDKDVLVKFAVEHRPDVAALRHLGSAAHDFAKEPMLRLVPVIALAGQATATNNPPPMSGRWNDESVGLTLTWPIYDAGVRYADKRSRDGAAEIADLNTRTLIRNVDNQVRSAMAVLRGSQAALTGAQQAMDASRLSVTETEILYKQGLAKAIELVDANDQRFQAEVAYAAAEYQMALAYLSLRQALGIDALGTEMP